MGGSLSTQVIIWSDTMLDWSIGECIGFNMVSKNPTIGIKTIVIPVRY
jgi:hypothetical protein